MFTDADPARVIAAIDRYVMRRESESSPFLDRFREEPLHLRIRPKGAFRPQVALNRWGVDIRVASGMTREQLDDRLTAAGIGHTINRTRAEPWASWGAV
jgi:hypothetical protein